MGVAMAMFLDLVLAAVLYGFLADRTDRAVEREIRKRQPDRHSLHLVEDFDARPDLRPRYGRRLRTSPVLHRT
jgi:hypothetical protein